uniref:Uncharacterized protein n=1 Tax=Poecilia mexicana TaxID=48701 RepID=A0A3B3XPM3_9TELE
MCSIFLVLVRTRAAAFWISCSCLIFSYRLFIIRNVVLCGDKLNIISSLVLPACPLDLGVISLPRRCTTQILFSLLTLVLLLLLCVIRKKRRMEGKYRPSAEEKKQSRATAPERPRLPLPLPKEERLI